MKTAIIGLGKVGRTLAKALAEKDCLQWTYSESLGKKEFYYGIENYSNFDDILNIPDIILITKKDSVVKQTSLNLGLHFKARLSGKIVLHTSGTLDYSVLADLNEYGVITGSAHPYQTFYTEEPEILNGIAWIVEVQKNYEIVAELIRELNGESINIINIPEFNRNLYHISAIIASNYIQTIVRNAKISANASGIDSKKFLPAIIKTTTDNIIKTILNEQPFPLTGPIARADLTTIRKHVDSLKPYPELKEFYLFMAKETAKSAYSENIISKEEFESMILELNNSV